MLLRAQAARALRCLLPAASSRAAPSLAAATAAVPAATQLRLPHATLASAASAVGPVEPKDVQGEDAASAVDAETGLPLSAPPERQLRDTVEEITM